MKLSEQENDSPKITRGELLRGGMFLALTTTIPLLGCSPPKEAVVPSQEGFKVAPKLIGYRETTTLATGLRWARGLAVSGDNLWVAGDMELRLLNPTGKVLERHALPGAVHAVTLGPKGEIWCATDDQLGRLDGGVWTRCQSLGPRARLVSIAVQGENVYGADAGNRCIWHFDTDVSPKGKFGNAPRDGQSDDSLVVPSPYLGLAVTTKGELLVANPGRHRIQTHDANGNLLSHIGVQGMEIHQFCGCCNPTALAALPNGDIVTAEKGLPRVKVIGANGKLKSVVAGPALFHADTAGLELAVRGDQVLVLDPWHASVRVFEKV